MTDKQISAKIFAKDFLKKFLNKFIILILLVFFDGILLSVSVLSVIPLADLFFSSNPENYSKFTKYIINLFLIFHIPINIYVFFLFFILTTFLKAIFSIVINYYVINIKYSIYRSLFKDLFFAIFKTNWLFFNNLGEGKLFNTFRHELSKIGEAVGHLSISIAAFLQICIYLLAPLYINFNLTIVVIFSSFILIFPYRFLNNYAKTFGNKSLIAGNKFSSSVQEMLSGSKYFISINESQIPLNKALNFLEDHIKPVIYFSIINFSTEQFLRPIFILILFSVIIFGFNENISIPETAAIFWSLLATVPLISKLLNNFLQFINYSPSYYQFKNIYKKAQKYKEIDGKLIFSKFETSIEFKNVNFNYGSVNILNNCSFTILKNRLNIIVGKSGVGKSTIVDLITGIQIPATGKILLNGKNFADYNKKTFRNKISLVNQEPFLFYDTIKNNITLYNSNFSLSEIQDALKFSDSYDFIESLENKLETIIGERGTQISGGQRQRILLARAFLRKPDLMILDESINSLDQESQIKIMRNIRELSKNVTIVLISHDKINKEKNDNIINI